MFAAAYAPQRSYTGYTPAVNLYNSDKEVLLEMELPGYAKENVSVEYVDGTLKISAPARQTEREGFSRIYSERGEGGFERHFRVGEDLDASKVHARFDNGLLLVSLQKLEKAQPKKIEIA